MAWKCSSVEKRPPEEKIWCAEWRCFDFGFLLHTVTSIVRHVFNIGPILFVVASAISLFKILAKSALNDRNWFSRSWDMCSWRFHKIKIPKCSGFVANIASNVSQTMNIGRITTFLVFWSFSVKALAIQVFKQSKQGPGTKVMICWRFSCAKCGAIQCLHANKRNFFNFRSSETKLGSISS